MNWTEKQMSLEQSKSADGRKLESLKIKYEEKLNRAGYYSKAVAQLSNEVAKLKIKMGLIITTD